MQPGTETTVEEWEERFRKDVKRRPGWSVLPIEMLFSEAYRSLTGSAQLALQFALSQVSWEKTRRPGKRKHLKNDTVYLPTNALIALGIRSGSTRSALRRALVEKGFLDVKKSGSYLNCGVFKISGRWRYYPNGEYMPQDQPPPGVSMGHRFKSGDEEKDSEDLFLRSEIERKRGSEIERKGSTEKTPEVDPLRLKIERKPLRSEIERTVLCTMAEQDPDIQDIHVREDLGDQRTEDPLDDLSAIQEENHDSPYESSLQSHDSETLIKEVPGDEPIILQHQWFVDAFSTACSKRGVTSDLTLPPALASSLDDWITDRLSKRSFLGNRCVYDEKPNSIAEKIDQIVSQWESIEISYLGDRVQIPSVPDLEFLVIYRENIFGWVNERRQRTLNAVLRRLEIGEQAFSEGYTH